MKIKPGIYKSEHACTIPHPGKPTMSSINSACVFLKMPDGSVREAPANLHHYLNPEEHKPYARFMPDLLFIDWILAEQLEFLDFDGADHPEATAVPYGYMSYVRKNGFLDSGLYDFGRRIGERLPYPERAGELVMTVSGDRRLLQEKVHLQKEEYQELCSEMSKRFKLQVLLYNLFEKKPAAGGGAIEQAKIHDVQSKIRALLEAGGDIGALFDAVIRVFKGESDRVDIEEPVAIHYSLHQNESKMILAILQSQYYFPFNFDLGALKVTFQKPSEEVMAQKEAYQKACVVGYTNPSFFRSALKSGVSGAGATAAAEKPETAAAAGGGSSSPPKKEEDLGYDSDDDLRSTCTIM